MKIWEPTVEAAKARFDDEERTNLEADKSKANEAIVKNKRGNAISIAPQGRVFIGRPRDFHSLWGSTFTLAKTENGKQAATGLMAESFLKLNNVTERSLLA